MNTRQRILLVIGALLVLAMTLFPPWIYVYQREKLVKAQYDSTTGQIVREAGQQTAGYHLIFTYSYVPTPAYDTAQAESESALIDKDRFAVQLLGLMLIIILLFFALRS